MSKSSKALKKQSWLERAVNTYNYHAAKVKANPRWVIQDTANALGRSFGSVSEDLVLASWCRTHRDKLEKFKYAKDAIAFIRECKAKLKIIEISDA